MLIVSSYFISSFFLSRALSYRIIFHFSNKLVKNTQQLEIKEQKNKMKNIAVGKIILLLSHFYSIKNSEVGKKNFICFSGFFIFQLFVLAPMLGYR
jgi:hypothetical protein